MSELTDERLQDYLDGRLGDAERAEVEALLRADPERARRVESWRAIGRSLRQADDRLSPGFYARARERFRQSRPSGLRGWRLLSWESAGLAAAAVLAIAIFVPALMQDPQLGPTTAGRTDEAAAEAFRSDGPAPARESERLKSEGSAADAPQPLPKVATPPVEEMAGGRRQAAEKQRPAPTTNRPGARAEVERESGDVLADRDLTASEPAASKKKGLEAGRGRSAPDSAGEFAPVPPAEGPTYRQEAELRASPAEAAAAPEADLEDSGDSRRTPSEDDTYEQRSTTLEPPLAEQAEAAGLSDAVRPGVAKLTADAVVIQSVVVKLTADNAPPRGVHIVHSRQEWDRWLAGPAGDALAPLGGYDDDRRLVLVGVEPADCESLILVRDSTGYRITLERDGTAAGCAFVLAADGFPVMLEE